MSDPRDTEHIRCDCVPSLGPPHCHQHELETVWPCDQPSPICPHCLGRGEVGFHTLTGYDTNPCRVCLGSGELPKDEKLDDMIITHDLTTTERRILLQNGPDVYARTSRGGGWFKATAMTVRHNGEGPRSVTISGINRKKNGQLGARNAEAYFAVDPELKHWLLAPEWALATIGPKGSTTTLETS